MIEQVLLIMLPPGVKLIAVFQASHLDDTTQRECLTMYFQVIGGGLFLAVYNTCSTRLFGFCLAANWTIHDSDVSV